MKKILNHPIVLFIGFFSAVIGILVFFTGKPDINKFFNSSDKLDSFTTKNKDTLNLEYDPSLLDSLQVAVEKTSEILDSYISNLRKTKNFCEYLEIYLGFTAVVPKDYSSSSGIDDDDEMCVLLNVSMKNLSPDAFLFRIYADRDTIPINSQKAFLRGFFKSFLVREDQSETPENILESVEYDNQFQPCTIDGKDFWSLNIVRHYSDGMIIHQKSYSGFVKNHFVKMLTNAVTTQQDSDCKQIINSIHFEED